MTLNLRIGEHTLTVAPTDTVGSLQDILAKRTENAVAFLVVDGKYLAADKTLKELGITEESKISLVTNLTLRIGVHKVEISPTEQVRTLETILSIEVKSTAFKLRCDQKDLSPNLTFVQSHITSSSEIHMLRR